MIYYMKLFCYIKMMFNGKCFAYDWVPHETNFIELYYHVFIRELGETSGGVPGHGDGAL